MMTSALVAAACSSSGGYCPGLCPAESTFPTMTIEVDGGTASIASARIVSGPCSYLLIHSEGEAGAQHSYAAAQITYTGPSDTPPLCRIGLTSVYGNSAEVTASLSATSQEEPCCPYGSCCAKNGATPLHRIVAFDWPTQTISFPVPPGLDGGIADAILDIEGTPVDAADDSAADVPENAVEDVPLDGASQSTIDADRVLDLASVS